MGLTPAIWSLPEFRKTLYILKNVSKPTQELIDHILRFSTNFVSESARLAQVWVWEQGVVTLCWGSWVNQLYLVCRPLGVLVAHRQRQWPSSMMWSGVDIFVWVTWRPPSFVKKLLSGTRGHGDRGYLQALVATQEETRERLGGREVILFVSDSKTWSRRDFVSNRTTG